MPTPRPLTPLRRDATLDGYVLDVTSAGVDIKSAIMAYAALRRGFDVLRTGKRTIVVDAGGAGRLAFHGINGPRSSVAGKAHCDDKVATRAFLDAAGLTTVASRTFARRGLDQAWAFAERVGGRVVVKPIARSRGRGITTDVRDRGALEAAFDHAFAATKRAGPSQRVLVERHVDGDDVRFFVVGTQMVSATYRRRPQVIGDGSSSVEALIGARNERRALNPYLRASPIPLDIALLDALRRSGRDLRSVPRPGEVVVLRGTSNLSGGGDSIDLGERVHPGFVEIAVRAVAAVPGVAYGGVDVIAPDVSVAPTPDNHVVGEVEFSPGPVSQFPVEGPARDMSGAVLAFYLTSPS